MESPQVPGGRILVLVRHAQAEPSAPSDHARVLSASGVTAAADVGTWLAGRGIRPDVGLVSDAARTRQTWTEAAQAAGWDLQPTVTAALYTAGPDAVLDLLAEVPDDVTTVVVVGHNPTIAYLAGVLDDGLGDADASTRLVVGGYAPATATVFELGGSWGTLRDDGARVRSLHVGR